MGNFTVQEAFLFNYTDPVSGEATTNQGIIMDLSDQARIFVRPSGTNSSGATLKVYLSQKSNTLNAEVSTFLKPLEQAAQELLQIQKYLGDKIDISAT